MLNISQCAELAKKYNVVDFDRHNPNKTIWFRGVKGYYIIVKEYPEFSVFTVWEDDDCDNMIDNIQIDSEEKFNKCLKKYALIAQ